MRDIIFCSGIMRSASTWSFNVCRMIAEYAIKSMKGNVVVGYADGDNLEQMLAEKAFKEEGFLVIKSHFFKMGAIAMIADKKAKNVCTLRDPLDCIASRKEFVDEPYFNSINNIKACLANVEKFRKIGNTLFIQYRDIQRNPKQEIKRIIDYLKYDVPESLIDEIEEKTSMDAVKKIMSEIPFKSQYDIINNEGHRTDKLTQYHENHIQDGKNKKWETVLTPKEQKVARKKLKGMCVV